MKVGKGQPSTEEVRALALELKDRYPRLKAADIAESLRDKGIEVGTWTIAGWLAHRTKDANRGIKRRTKPKALDFRRREKKRFIDNELDKKTMPKKSGRCLILEGTPFTETESLLNAGIRPDQILIVERKRATFEVLQREYKARIQVLNMDLEEVLDDESQTYSYIHIDPCGTFGAHELGLVEKVFPLLAKDGSRLRVTAFTNRRQPERVHKEIFSAVSGLCSAAERLDLKDRGRWAAYREQFQQRGNPRTYIAQAMAFSMVFRAMFDMTIEGYLTFLAAADVPMMPPHPGNTRVKELEWYCYKEGKDIETDRMGSSFVTVWVDYAPTTKATDMVEELAAFFERTFDGPPILPIEEVE